MAGLKFYKLIISLLILLNSCEFFNTREPEVPNSSDNQYLPQTSADAVISNFVRSFSEVNNDKYIGTFVNNINFSNFTFKYFPNPEVNVQFPSLFESWNLQNESQFINSLKLKIINSKKILLVLSNLKADYQTDSTLFTYNYYCQLDSTLKNIPTKFSGILQFVVVKNLSGIWAIQKWYDYQSNDSIKNTISNLKAILSN